MIRAGVPEKSRDGGIESDSKTAPTEVQGGPAVSRSIPNYGLTYGLKKISLWKTWLTYWCGWGDLNSHAHLIPGDEKVVRI
jgi:hypothetical protein